MLDLVAAIVSADPPSLLAWLILAFAAAGYPLGIMLGSNCSPCCGSDDGPPCAQCTEGKLPNTVTVSISGYVDGMVQGPDLASLVFSSNFGGGAQGKVAAPGGDPETDSGPVSAVLLTSAGSGYARIARVEPSVTAEAEGGSGAVIEVTLEEIDNGGRPAWRVSGLSATNGGTGYPATGPVIFSLKEGDTEDLGASATFRCQRVLPAISLSVNGTGTGAELAASLTYDSVNDFWYVGSVTVVSGGTGYTAGEPVGVTVTDGEQEWNPFSMAVSVNGNGAVTGVVVDNPFPFYPPYNRGSFFKNSGVISKFEVAYGGIYYRDDPTVPCETADVTVTVSQTGPTSAIAFGAEFSVTIDDDDESETFGEITGITITKGGHDYLAWAARKKACCQDFWNSKSVVLRRGIGQSSCVFSHSMCGTVCGAGVEVHYRGPTLPPLVYISDGDGCSANLQALELIADCSAFSFTASNLSGVTASVSAGGSYGAATDAFSSDGRCMTCCRGDSVPPPELEVELRALAEFTEDEWVPPYGFGEVPIVVLSRGLGNPCGGWSGQAVGFVAENTIAVPYTVSVSLEPCDDPYEIDCDDCWKRCVTKVRAVAPAPGQGGNSTGFGDTQLCQQCTQKGVDSPLCEPASGDYIIENNDFNQGVWFAGAHAKAKVTIA